MIVFGGATGNAPLALAGFALFFGSAELMSHGASVCTPWGEYDGPDPCGTTAFIALDEEGRARELDKLTQRISGIYGASAEDSEAVADLVYDRAIDAVQSGIKGSTSIRISGEEIAKVTSPEFQLTPGYAELVRDLSQ